MPFNITNHRLILIKIDLSDNRSYQSADKIRRLGTKNVKGFALKTHEGLCPSTLRAFEKARAKLLSVLGKVH